MFAITIGGKTTEFGPRLASDDDVKRSCGDNRAQHLRHNIRNEARYRELAGHRQTDGNRRIKMTAGNASDRIGHGQNRQAESKSNAEKPNAELWETGSENRAATATEDKPERSQKFRKKFATHNTSP